MMRKTAATLARRGYDIQRRKLSHASLGYQHPAVQITTLSNKIRVATESTPGHFSSVGLYVDAGSRYEDPSTAGASHFLDRMAFKSTGSRSNAEMSTAMDALGGQIMCSSSRESIMYQSSHFHTATPLALSLISDTVLNASFLPEEVDAQKDAARYEIREVSAKPDMILPEVLHNVAYGGKTLGNPLLCPEDRIDVMGESVLRGCVKDWYRPERMVIAGAGMRHEELVELADKYFSSLKSVPLVTPQLSISRQSSPSTPVHLLPSSSPSLTKSLARSASSYFLPTITDSHSTYTGGQRHVFDASQEFNHLYIAFEGIGIHDEDIFTLATMQVLLGGGGSFSAGGPGKGMYSRLYTNILNHFPQIDHCASFHHIYTDSSLFGLFASFVPYTSRHQGNTPAQIIPHLVHQLSLLLYEVVPRAELSRAKNQLKSSLMMALESQAIEVEDLGRQIIVHNRRVPVTEMTDKIDQVTPESVLRVAKRVFGPDSGNKATVVTMGRDDVGDWRGVLQKYGVAAA